MWICCPREVGKSIHKMGLVSCTDHFTQHNINLVPMVLRGKKIHHSERRFTYGFLWQPPNLSSPSRMLLAVFTHRKLPFVTPGIKNIYEGDSKFNNHEEEVVVNWTRHWLTGWRRYVCQRFFTYILLVFLSPSQPFLGMPCYAPPNELGLVSG